MRTTEKLLKQIMAIPQMFAREKNAKTPGHVNILFSGVEILYLCSLIFVSSSCGREPGLWVPACNVQNKTLFLTVTATNSFGHFC